MKTNSLRFQTLINKKYFDIYFFILFFTRVIPLDSSIWEKVGESDK